MWLFYATGCTEKRTSGSCPCTPTTAFLASTPFARDAKVAYAYFLFPEAVSSPLCQGTPGRSARMNQMNIWTRASLRAMLNACWRYERCVEKATPRESGLVSCPYSVIQIGMLVRLNHLSSDCSNLGRLARLTFGQRIFWVGLIDGEVGYGWCAQASNLIFGRTLLSRSANFPGECVSWRPLRLTGRSRPFEAVSPIATSASRLPPLTPA